MIKLNDGKIGAKEFFAIIIFMIGLKFKDTTPDLLYSVGDNAAWMMPLFSLVFYAVPFLLLVILLKKHGIGLVDLIFKMAGKYVGTFICIILFIVFFVSTIINLRSHAEIVNTLFFQRTPISVLFFFIIITSFYIAKKGLETIGHTAWLVFPFLQGLMVFLIILMWQQITWGFIFPIAGPGFTTIMKESVKHASMFGEVILLAAFYPFLRSENDFRKSAGIGVVFSYFQVAFFLFLFVAIFDYPEVDKMNFPYQELTRYVTIGPIVSHLEGIFLGFWSVATAIHFAVYLFISGFLLSGILRLNKTTPLLIPIAGLAFFIGLFPENVFILQDYRHATVRIGSWIVFFLPIFLWVMDKWKGRMQN